MRHVLLSLLLCCPAAADPAPPLRDQAIAQLQPGVFCALQAMDRRPAPGTRSGWVHVPEGEIDFHWPDRQIVPAAIGLAFGVKAQLRADHPVAYGEMRVYSPGSTTPEIWDSTLSPFGASIAFFRFDHDHELIPGLWRFEAWEGETRLYAVEFQVVPAATLPDLVQACGAVS